MGNIAVIALIVAIGGLVFGNIPLVIVAFVIMVITGLLAIVCG